MDTDHQIEELDLQMTHALDMRILSLSVGIQLRTQKGTGWQHVEQPRALMADLA